MDKFLPMYITLSQTKTPNRTRFKVHILGMTYLAFFQPAALQNHWRPKE